MEGDNQKNLSLKHTKICINHCLSRQLPNLKDGCVGAGEAANTTKALIPLMFPLIFPTYTPYISICIFFHIWAKEAEHPRLLDSGPPPRC